MLWLVCLQLALIDGNGDTLQLKSVQSAVSLHYTPPQSTVRSPQSAVRSLQSAVRRPQSIVCNPESAVSSQPFTLSGS